MMWTIPSRSWVVLVAAVPAGVALGLMVAHVQSADLLGWATLLLGLVIVVSISTRNRNLGLVMLSGFGLRASAALLNYYAISLPDSRADALMFERVGQQWAESGAVAVLQQFTTGAHLYSWLIALLYSLVGRSMLMIQALNVIFGSFVILNVYLTSCELWGRPNSLRAAWIIAVFPSMVLYSAITLREVAVVYPLTLGVLYLVRWERSGRWWHMGVATVLLLSSSLFHSGMVVTLGCAGVVVAWKWATAFAGARRVRLITATTALALVAIVLSMIISRGLGMDKFGSPRSITVDRIMQQTEGYAHGRTSYLVGVTAHSPFELARQMPIRVAYFLFGPFPWTVRAPQDAFGALDALLYLSMSYLAWRSVRKSGFSQTGTLVLLLFALVTVFAVSTSNYGTAIRHRAKLLPLLVCLLVPLRRERREVKA